jgi:hypothetical protein
MDQLHYTAPFVTGDSSSASPQRTTSLFGMEVLNKGLSMRRRFVLPGMPVRDHSRFPFTGNHENLIK